MDHGWKERRKDTGTKKPGYRRRKSETPRSERGKNRDAQRNEENGWKEGDGEMKEERSREMIEWDR